MDEIEKIKNKLFDLRQEKHIIRNKLRTHFLFLTQEEIKNYQQKIQEINDKIEELKELKQKLKNKPNTTEEKIENLDLPLGAKPIMSML